MRTTIEALLAWAYRDELAKREFTDSLGIGNSLSSLSMLGTNVSGGRPQGYAELVGMGIDPDALLVEQAVNALRGLQLVVEDPRLLLSDMGVALEVEAVKAFKGYRVEPDALVARMAKMGARPEWMVEVPELKVVRGQNGAPAWFVKREIHYRSGDDTFVQIGEENGRDPKTRRPRPDAYRKYTWEPDPGWAVDARADYVAWRLSLARIAESLIGRMARWNVSPPGARLMPWVTGLAAGAALVIPQAPVGPREKRKKKAA